MPSLRCVTVQHSYNIRSTIGYGRPSNLSPEGTFVFTDFSEGGRCLRGRASLVMGGPKVTNPPPLSPSYIECIQSGVSFGAVCCCHHGLYQEF